MAWKEPSVSEARRKLIDKYRQSFRRKAKTAQGQFLSLIEGLLTDGVGLDENGNVRISPENYSAINRLFSGSQAFAGGPMNDFLKWMNDSLTSINEVNSRYFQSISPDNFNSGIKRAAEDSLAAKFGVSASGLRSNGIVAAIGAKSIQDGYEAARKAALSGISQGLSFSQYKRQLTDAIRGTGGALGAIENALYTGLYDSFQQYDREIQKTYAKELDLKYAIYNGDVRDTTRDWCAQHAGNVYSEEEIEEWKNKDWAGKNKPGYNPFTDCGGYNCTHVWNWISEELAFQLRPDLIKENPPPKKDPASDAKTPKIKFTPVKSEREAMDRLKNLGLDSSFTKQAKIQEVNAVLSVMERIYSTGRLSGLPKVTMTTNRRAKYLARYSYYKRPGVSPLMEDYKGMKPVDIQVNIGLIQDFTKDPRYYAKASDKIKDSKMRMTKLKEAQKAAPESHSNMYKIRIEREEKLIIQLEKNIQARGDLAYNVLPKDMSSEGLVRVVTNHEMAHHLHLYKFDEIDPLFAFNRYTVPSEYALTNKKEYFAEWYAHYMEYGSAKVPDDLLKVFKMIE